MDWNLPYDVSADMVDEAAADGTVEGPFYIEFWCGGVWELFSEVEELNEIAYEVRILMERGFTMRVKDSKDREVKCGRKSV